MPVPPSFIKNVALEIDNGYGLQNTPVSSEKNSNPQGPFIGRKLHIEKLLAFLNAEVKKGVFLVTGYRGMGKTSFVNFVLKKYKEQRIEKEDGDRSISSKIFRLILSVIPFFKNIYLTERIIPIHLTLAQNNPKELDILRLIVMSVFDEYKNYITKKWRFSLYVFLDLRYALKLLFIPFLILLSPLAVWISTGQKSYVSFSHSFLTDIVDWEHYGACVIGVSIFLAASYLFVSYMIYWRQNQKTAFNRIRWLVDRCYSSLSEENTTSDEAGVPVINIKLSRGEKRTKQYPIATAKEMEYELQVFLKKAFERHKVEFIFIFDELDKLDAPVNGPYLYDEPVRSEDQKTESAYERELRERKQAIINIITGLKNFFTTANAHFIFIAGREMFDASLADISDRQSPISSIFTYIFNIESLLKERDLSISRENGNNASLSFGLEVYLKKLLFGPGADPDDNQKLFALARERYVTSRRRPDSDNNKLYFTLQNFITYLTYRSNGSPKKLIKEIHEFIKVKVPEVGFDPEQTLIYRQHDHNDDRLYLYFSYDNQYRTGFINYLYRPFLIRHGRSFKLYSDNIIVSTPYLFDHFLKFHPFAFSLSNLELVPEMLSSNKTPSLREHIRQIISYLSGSHIREIEIGLFDYKFYSRTLNEITYLSKIFEQEAAALNYTLDESHLVKLHVRNKISDLRNTYSKFLEGENDNRKIASVAHLNGILGDLHFFDQEYDDAIVAYEDSIRPIENLSMAGLSMMDFITLLRDRLKAGLCYEKISSYEYALSSYSDTSDDAVRYMSYRLRPGVPGMDKSPFSDEEEHIPGSAKPSKFYSGPLSDLLQIVLQSFVSQIYIQEKKSVAGISELKLCMSLASFLNIAGGFYANTDRNHIIKAQAFLQAGNLFYFKNSERRPNQNAYEGILPPSFNELLVKLMDWDAFYNKKSQVSEKPVLALFMYLIGLDEMAGYYQSGRNILSEACEHKNIVAYLFKVLQLTALPRPEEKRLRGIYYNYMATFLSVIGDSLLANYIQGETGHSFFIEDIFDIERLTKSRAPEAGATFDSFLREANPDKFGMQDVLKCYFLSGNYFLRQGKVSSCSFQYKKILHVLRLILRTSHLSEDSMSSFFILLRTAIVDPLLDFASQNAAYAEPHMKNKAKDAEVGTVYAKNNLSNHPETREVWLLYYYIQLKTTEAEIKDIKYLIASDNSFATQYGRIQELHFYAKYLRRKFRQQPNGGADSTLKSIDKTHLEGCVSYLYTMLSILQIMDIYGSDYWMGFSYLASIHFEIARFLAQLFGGDILLKDIRAGLSVLMGDGSFSSLDTAAHFSKALDCYDKAKRLHQAGEEYKETISDMICLEDDFNDSAYHFGAALDRYKMNNNLFNIRMKDCERWLKENRKKEYDG